MHEHPGKYKFGTCFWKQYRHPVLMNGSAVHTTTGTSVVAQHKCIASVTIPSS
jgi:hypothetical protein